MITLVLGGTASGKSLIAEELAGELGNDVTFVATAVATPGDADHAARIDAHRARRPASWSTLECSALADLPGHLRRIAGVALVDSLGSWLALAPGFDVSSETADLLAALAERDAPTVLVSEEVGLAVHPPSEAGRRYTEALGELNQRVAAAADRVLLVVAGRALELPCPSGAT
ncbi:MAG: bifunctional adenosylcobinamide kinase/adenosylcobinamide-phosphate guanylyltransferase [Acidimicrobiia bacterium]|nr:bifunctional adenosylcobinamide kinase/adenosylcobinamide-phosphate guanylyltransferase [Acidimicrobiia bacterium]